MSSSSYSRVLPRAPTLKMYGFQKVSDGEVRAIVGRLQRKTYNSTLQHDYSHPKGLSPVRASSAPCRRNTPDLASAGTPAKHERKSSKEIERIFRRMRTPTLSYRAARGEITPLHELDDKRPEDQSPRSADEVKKSLRRITRPTTSTKTRTFCTYCKDPDLEEWHDIDFSDDKIVSQDQLDDIIKRVATPTVASEGGKTGRCRRRKDSVATEMSKRRGLPLVSGMPRSQNIQEVTDRVYYQPFERQRRRTPQATRTMAP